MVATSATRDAANRDEFFDMTADVLGAVVPGAVAEVITGAEEAELSFIGAVAELDTAAAPFVVVDLGGGSTEVVVGSRRADTGYSADIGCVRITERCLHPIRRPPVRSRPAAPWCARARRRTAGRSGGGPGRGWGWRARSPPSPRWRNG
jgi:exopolyphosphatase/guanosine-5'-triphosphate,3'-diphosphate pyrophosphatase